MNGWIKLKHGIWYYAGGHPSGERAPDQGAVYFALFDTAKKWSSQPATDATYHWLVLIGKRLTLAGSKVRIDHWFTGSEFREIGRAFNLERNGAIVIETDDKVEFAQLLQKDDCFEIFDADPAFSQRPDGAEIFCRNYRHPGRKGRWFKLDNWRLSKWRGECKGWRTFDMPVVGLMHKAAYDFLKNMHEPQLPKTGVLTQMDKQEAPSADALPQHHYRGVDDRFYQGPQKNTGLISANPPATGAPAILCEKIENVGDQAPLGTRSYFLGVVPYGWVEINRRLSRREVEQVSQHLYQMLDVTGNGPSDDKAEPDDGYKRRGEEMRKEQEDKEFEALLAADAEYRNESNALGNAFAQSLKPGTHILGTQRFDADD